MRGRVFNVSGLFVALALTMWTTAFAQAQTSGAITGTVQGQTANAPARAAAPQSPTFARIQVRTNDFKEAGGPMTYEVYVPTKYNASRPTPLIIALHGLGSNPTQVIRYQGLTDLRLGNWRIG